MTAEKWSVCVCLCVCVCIWPVGMGRVRVCLSTAAGGGYGYCTKVVSVFRSHGTPALLRHIGCQWTRCPSVVSLVNAYVAVPLTKRTTVKDWGVHISSRLVDLYELLEISHSYICCFSSFSFESLQKWNCLSP